MPTEEIRTAAIQVANGDLQIDAYLAEPAAAGSYPAVIVVQEIFGVNAHIRDVAERFAREGYVAIAPAIYQRLAPGFETGYTPESIKIGREYKTQTKADELLSDLQATIDHLKQHPKVKGDAIGSIGFCFGGHVVYLGATLPEIKATASFYGAGIATWCPGSNDNEPTVARTAEIKGTIYLFFGNEDASIPATEVEQIEVTLKQHDIPHRLFRYDGADHGFFCDQRGSYSPEAAAAAWVQVKQLFQQTLNKT